MTPDCIFCKIAHGQIPSAKVYEDDQFLAFMDIGPVIKGHTLVMPKAHYDPLVDTPAEVLRDLIVVVQKVARAQQKALGTDGINVIQNNGRVAGQAVPHLHFHVIPRFDQDGHRWNWVAGQYADPAEMQRLAQALRTALE